MAQKINLFLAQRCNEVWPRPENSFCFIEVIDSPLFFVSFVRVNDFRETVGLVWINIYANDMVWRVC